MHQNEEIISKTPAYPPPGPKGLQFLKVLLEVRYQNPETLVRFHREHGDTVLFPLPDPRLFVIHPDDIQHILKTNGKNYRKSDSYEELVPLLGQGLLTSEGEHWRQQRRLIAPEFHISHLIKFLPIIRDLTEEMLIDWEKSASQLRSRDFSKDFMKLTLRIASKTLFGPEIGDRANELGDALETASEIGLRRIISPFKFPRHWPTPENKRAIHAIETLNEILNDLISRERPDDEAPTGSFLERLKSQMPPEHLADELMTFLLAGHETTSNLLSWTCYLIAENPSWFSKLQEEIRNNLGHSIEENVTDLEHLRSLTQLNQCMMESLRLYPPAPGFSRNSIEADQLRKTAVPPNHIVAIMTYVTHRMKEFWPNPTQFHPERFSKDSIKKQHPYAFIPFGGGARRCIGENFAILESLVILATILDRFTWQKSPSRPPVIPEALITLRPKHGTWMKLQSRVQ